MMHTRALADTHPHSLTHAHTHTHTHTQCADLPTLSLVGEIFVQVPVRLLRGPRALSRRADKAAPFRRDVPVPLLRARCSINHARFVVGVVARAAGAAVPPPSRPTASRVFQPRLVFGGYVATRSRLHSCCSDISCFRSVRHDHLHGHDKHFGSVLLAILRHRHSELLLPET
jgi:hypothetical protein